MGQLFTFMHISNCIRRLKQTANGAVFDTIIVDTFKQLKVIKPSQPLIDLFTTAVSPLFNQILNLTLQNIILRRTRDKLLPKLISGEIDVSSWVEGGGEAAALELAGSVVGTGDTYEHGRQVRRVAESGPVAPIDKEGMGWQSLWE